MLTLRDTRRGQTTGRRPEAPRQARNGGREAQRGVRSSCTDKKDHTKTTTQKKQSDHTIIPDSPYKTNRAIIQNKENEQQTAQDERNPGQIRFHTMAAKRCTSKQSKHKVGCQSYLRHSFNQGMSWHPRCAKPVMMVRQPPIGVQETCPSSAGAHCHHRRFLAGNSHS